MRLLCLVIDPYRSLMQPAPFISRAHESSIMRTKNLDAICTVHGLAPVSDLKGHSLSLPLPPNCKSYLCLFSLIRFPDQENENNQENTIQEIKKSRMVCLRRGHREESELQHQRELQREVRRRELQRNTRKMEETGPAIQQSAGKMAVQLSLRHVGASLVP